MDEELFDPSCSACERAQEDFAKQEQRIAELESERIDSQAQLMVERRELLAKLAAAQATIQRKDEALRPLAECHIPAMRGIYEVRAHFKPAQVAAAKEALAIPADRTALDAMLKPYRDALTELVALKDQKEAAAKEVEEARAIKACPSVKTQRLLRDYEERKPAAWAAARAVLQADAIHQAAERSADNAALCGPREADCDEVRR